MAIVVKCPGTPFGYECIAHRRSNEGPCTLRALPLFEVVYWSGGKLVSYGVAQFRGDAERAADRLRRFERVRARVRPWRPKETRSPAHAQK